MVSNTVAECNLQICNFISEFKVLRKKNLLNTQKSALIFYLKTWFCSNYRMLNNDFSEMFCNKSFRINSMWYLTAVIYSRLLSTPDYTQKRCQYQIPRYISCLKFCRYSHQPFSLTSSIVALTFLCLYGVLFPHCAAYSIFLIITLECFILSQEL